MQFAFWFIEEIFSCQRIPIWVLKPGGGCFAFKKDIYLSMAFISLHGDWSAQVDVESSPSCGRIGVPNLVHHLSHPPCGREAIGGTNAGSLILHIAVHIAHCTRQLRLRW